MSFLQAIIVYFVLPLLTLLTIVVFVHVILSWLVAFNVVNPRNQLVYTIGRMCASIVEPLLSPIRRILPPLGGMDLSPIILLLLIMFIRNYVIAQLIYPNV
ncbi:YggT family protein [Glycocaulis profundi]|jgi:YggT family protein|nr:YggT family protein [Glycocaulis profundi]